MGLLGIVKSIFMLIFLVVYAFIFLVIFFGVLAEANNLYNVSKIVNILISLFDTVLLFTIPNMYLFGENSFGASVALLGLIFVLIFVAEAVTNTYPKLG